jgi:hypothetical protein
LTLFDDTEANSIIPDPDSTHRGIYGIDSRYMKRAALYARVSTDAQQKEATIESQLFELKKQIAAVGHALIKEYIDDGYSGTLLDRPAACMTSLYPAPPGPEVPGPEVQGGEESERSEVRFREQTGKHCSF